MINEIMNALQTKGYNVALTETNKNGVIKKGITFKGNTVAPIIYYESLIAKHNNVDDIVAEIIDIYEHAYIPKFDVSNLIEKSFIENNIYVGIHKHIENTHYITRPTDIEGIDEYMYVRIDEESTFKVSAEMIKKIDTDIDTLFDVAHENTFKNTSIISIAEMLGQPEFADMPYVIRNSESLGASSILDKNALSFFGTTHHVDKIFVIPSSIHECLIIPYNDSININDLSAMVSDVNSSQVEPEEQLLNHAFILNVA